MHFSVNDVISKVLEWYVQPDHTALRQLIDDRKYAHFAAIHQEQWGGPITCKILFTDSETVVVQWVHLPADSNRFPVEQIRLENFDEALVEWITPDHAHYAYINRCWGLGASQYTMHSPTDLSPPENYDHPW
jgi:hypothetical protein